MAITTKTPVRTVYDASNAAVGLAEFQTDEVVSITHGGTSGNSVSTAKLALSLTDSNIRSLFSVSGSGSFDNSTGIITVTGGVTSVGGATGTVSNAQIASAITATGTFATLASPTFTGTPLAPTAVAGTSNTMIATTAFVTTAVTNLIDSAPATLNTLNELAAALGNDNNFSAVVITQLGNKANTASLTTANVTEVTNLYFSNARARSALSAGDGTIVYDPATGQIRATANITATIENTVNNLTTSDVTEGSRLYFTNARVFSAVTGNLALKANVVDLTTANVTELTNLYFTNARVFSAVAGNLTLKANVVDLTTANVFEINNIESRTYNVTNAGSGAYVFSGYASGSNISITATAGAVLNFVVNASGHPFWIKTAAVTGTGSAVTTGVTNNGAESGTVIWDTKNITPGTYYYICQYHGGMVGTITILERPYQYFTNTRSRAAISVGSGGSYDNSTGIITITGGFVVSSVTVFPGHSGNVDYGDLTTTTADAFGVATGTAYDCMEPIGSLVSENLEVL